MKRMFILVAIAMLVAGALFADEGVLIDFSTLVADIRVETEAAGTGADQAQEQDATPNQNRQTMMDYGSKAGGSFTEEQKQVMRTSLAITNWDVILASSSRSTNNEVLSYVREAPSKQWGTVMGVRIHFPLEPWNSHAFVRPPFEIPAFEGAADVGDDGTITPAAENEDGTPRRTRFEAQGDAGPEDPAYGVIKNVGAIKSIAVDAYGLNFPHGLSAVYLDSAGKEHTVFMGYLNYDGWAQLTWNNPAYIQNVRNRELRLYPLYPTTTPFIKFAGFLITRDAAHEGGDFVGYFKSVKVIYDKAVLDTDRDIDDESLWNIIRTREDANTLFEMSRFGQKQVLRYLDQQKQATENEFTPTAANGGDGQGQQQQQQ